MVTSNNVVKTLLLVNSGVNVIIYFVNNRKIKNFYKNLLCSKKKEVINYAIKERKIESAGTGTTRVTDVAL